MLGGLQSIVARDLRLSMRRRGDVLNHLVFFVIVVTLFPLGVGAEPNLLRSMAPGIVWVAALLALTGLGMVLVRRKNTAQ